MRNQDNPASFSDYDPDGQMDSDVDYDYDTGKCDKCEESFPNEDLRNHDDGNVYCVDCNYMTKEDHLDALVDSYDGD